MWGLREIREYFDKLCNYKIRQLFTLVPNKLKTIEGTPSYFVWRELYKIEARTPLTRNALVPLTWPFWPLLSTLNEEVTSSPN
jgi:hypothetical protein